MWSFRPRKQGASTRQSRRCLPTGMVQSEHDAIHSYLGELEKQGIAKPETHAERIARRDAGISWLKEVLSILSGGESLFEQKSSKKFLHPHSVA